MGKVPTGKVGIIWLIQSVKLQLNQVLSPEAAVGLWRNFNDMREAGISLDFSTDPN